MFPILGWGFGLGHFLHIFVTHVPKNLSLPPKIRNSKLKRKAIPS